MGVLSRHLVPDFESVDTLSLTLDARPVVEIVLSSARVSAHRYPIKKKEFVLANACATVVCRPTCYYFTSFLPCALSLSFSLFLSLSFFLSFFFLAAAVTDR